MTTWFSFPRWERFTTGTAPCWNRPASWREKTAWWWPAFSSIPSLSLIHILFFILVIWLWQYLSDQKVWKPYLFPSPLEVWEYLCSSFLDGSLEEASWITVKRLVMGYGIGLVMGIPLGMLCSRFQLMQNTLGLVSLGFQALPSVCWVPLATLWFGQTEGAMLFVVIMGTLWSVILATANGMRNVPPIYARAARTMGAGPIYCLIHVTLPASAPFVVSGMKQGWAFAWRSLMAAEIFVPILTGFGLGQLLHFGRELSLIHISPPGQTSVP